MKFVDGLFLSLGNNKICQIEPEYFNESSRGSKSATGPHFLYVFNFERNTILSDVGVAKGGLDIENLNLLFQNRDVELNWSPEDEKTNTKNIKNMILQTLHF